jgi:hypothetical protein
MAQRLIMCSVNIKIELCVQVKNKPCVVNIIIMCLISWKRPRGSETVSTLQQQEASAALESCALTVPA